MINLNACEIEVLGSLLRARVRFIVVGGRAVNYHKILREAPDLDLFYSDEEDNSSRLRECLEQYGSLTQSSPLKGLDKTLIRLNYMRCPIDFPSKIEGRVCQNFCVRQLV